MSGTATFTPQSVPREGRLAPGRASGTGVWDQAVTEVRARLTRIQRGESWAHEQVVRCLTVFVAPEVRR